MNYIKKIQGRSDGKFAVHTVSLKITPNPLSLSVCLGLPLPAQLSPGHREIVVIIQT